MAIHLKNQTEKNRH